MCFLFRTAQHFFTKLTKVFISLQMISAFAQYDHFGFPANFAARICPRPFYVSLWVFFFCRYLLQLKCPQRQPRK